MRCLSLADKLAEKDWICYFACTEFSISTTYALANSNHNILELPLHPQKQPEYLMSMLPQGIELLVVAVKRELIHVLGCLRVFHDLPNHLCSCEARGLAAICQLRAGAEM